MLHTLFGRHGRTFARAIHAGEYVRTPQGIYFPRQGAMLASGFDYRAGDHVGGHAPNALSDLALVYLASLFVPVGQPGASASPLFPQLSLAICGSNNPSDYTWSDYDVVWFGGEYGDGPEGYSEVVRPTFVPLNEGGGYVGNTASPADFTIVTASTLPVYSFAVFGANINTKRSGLADTTPFNVNAVVTEIPDVSETTSYGHHYVIGLDEWYDPSADDFYDSGSGFWFDNAGDDFQFTTLPATRSLFAIADVGGVGVPLLLNDTDVLSVIYRLRLLG